MPATAAATRETKAKGSATLASSDNQCDGFVILVLSLIDQPIAARAWPLLGVGTRQAKEASHLDDCPL